MGLILKQTEPDTFLGGKPVRESNYKTGETLVYNRITKQWEAEAKINVQSHIVDADGTLGDATTKINAILLALENAGILNSS